MLKKYIYIILSTLLSINLVNANEIKSETYKKVYGLFGEMCGLSENNEIICKPLIGRIKNNEYENIVTKDDSGGFKDIAVLPFLICGLRNDNYLTCKINDVFNSASNKYMRYRKNLYEETKNKKLEKINFLNEEFKITEFGQIKKITTSANTLCILNLNNEIYCLNEKHKEKYRENINFQKDYNYDFIYEFGYKSLINSEKIFSNAVDIISSQKRICGIFEDKSIKCINSENIFNTNQKIYNIDIDNLKQIIDTKNFGSCLLFTNNTLNCYDNNNKDIILDKLYLENIPAKHFTNIKKVVQSSDTICILSETNETKCFGSLGVSFKTESNIDNDIEYILFGENKQFENNNNLLNINEIKSNVIDLFGNRSGICTLLNDNSVKCFGIILAPWSPEKLLNFTSLNNFLTEESKEKNN